MAYPQPNEVNSRLEAAKRFLQQGRLSEAEQVCLSVIEISPRDLNARIGLATIKMRRGDLEGARQWASKALEVDPRSHGALSFLCEMCFRNGEAAEATKWGEELVKLYPQDAHGWNNLGFCYAAGNQHELSATCFERATRLQPDFSFFHQNLGNAFRNLDRPRDAIRAYRRAAKLNPSSFDTFANLGLQLFTIGEVPEAVECCLKAYHLEPNTARGMVEGAKAHIYGDSDFARAERLIRQATHMDATRASDFGLLGYVLQKVGSMEQATECLRKSIELDPDAAGTYVDLLFGKRVTPEDIALVERMETMQADPHRSAYDRRMLSHALGKAHDDLGRYETAMAYCDEAHRIEREVLGKSFDQGAFKESFDTMIRVFTRDLLDNQVVPTSESNKPIFIVGMMRSGTTLVEQILSNHLDVGAGGELNFWVQRTPEAIDSVKGRLRPERCEPLIRDYLELLHKIGGDSLRVTDKMPDNYRLLGLIHKLFPEAKIIHCRRHPLDNCVSIYLQPFITPPDYVHDKETLAFAYREYRRMMRHWKSVLPAGSILDVNYQELVTRPEKVVRGLLEFCGLDWDEACLHPESNKRAVFTASYWQVRQPVYSSSLGRWQKYEPWLGPLLDLDQIEGDSPPE